jgi:hypothetical protein
MASIVRSIYNTAQSLTASPKHSFLVIKVILSQVNIKCYQELVKPLSEFKIKPISEISVFYHKNDEMCSK